MVLKSNYLFGCSLFLFLVGLNIGLLSPEETDPYSVVPETFPPLTWSDIAACAFVLFAIILAMVAARLWSQERREMRTRRLKGEIYKTVKHLSNCSNVLFYVLVVLAQMDFAFWLKVWHIVFTIQSTRVGDMDFAPQNSWDLSRPLIFSAVWTLLAIGLKSSSRAIKLGLVLCGLLAIASYVADYTDIYYFFFNAPGIENSFISYWRFGQWDVIRAVILPILMAWWMLKFSQSHTYQPSFPSERRGPKKHFRLS